MTVDTDRGLPQLPDTWGMPEDVLGTGQHREATAGVPDTSSGYLRIDDLVDPRFALAGLGAAARQATIEPDQTRAQPARASSDASEHPSRGRADYEYATLTLEQRDSAAAMLAAGGHRDIAQLIHMYGSALPSALTENLTEKRRNPFSIGRELAAAFGQRLGIIPVAYSVAAPPEVRATQRATSQITTRPSHVAPHRQNSGTQRTYTPPQPQRPAGAQNGYTAARVAAPVALRRYDTPAPVLTERYAPPAAAARQHNAPAAPALVEQLISPTKLAELLRTINTNPQPRQYQPINLEAAAAAFTFTPDGTETLAARQSRVDAERAPTIPLPAIPLDENGVIIDFSTRHLPVVPLDRYSRIATEYQTAELHALPASDAEHDDSRSKTLSFEEDLAKMDARNKRLIVNEAIFHNFGQSADRLRMPLPPRGVNKQHGRVANRALNYIRAIPEDSPESKLAAALQMAEQFIQPEELLPLVTNAMAIAGITKAANGEQLAQVATAVANGLERATQHHVQARLEDPRVRADELPADLPISATAVPAPAESTTRYEGVDKAVNTATHGLGALHELFLQHDQSARDWVSAQGFVSGIDRALWQTDPELYNAAKCYFDLQGVRIDQIVATALLAYDGPENTADFLPVLQRSLSQALEELRVPSAAAN